MDQIFQINFILKCLAYGSSDALRRPDRLKQFAVSAVILNSEFLAASSVNLIQIYPKIQKKLKT